jgi:hypothetical protein
MRSLDVADLANDQRPTGLWAAALLHALARDEAAGRRPQRLTEPKLDTWSRFRGRLTSADFVVLLFEDAAVIHRVPFDPSAVGGPVQAGRLSEGAADSWVHEVVSERGDAAIERVRSSPAGWAHIASSNASGTPSRCARPWASRVLAAPSAASGFLRRRRSRMRNRRSTGTSPSPAVRRPFVPICTN